MSTTRQNIGALALAVVLGGGCALRADAISDSLQKAPAPVQATVKAMVGDNKIGEFDSEVADGKTVYDVEYSIKGTNYALDISPTGEIVEREVAIDASALPPEVVDAAKKDHADTKINEPAIITAGDKMYYEVEMKVGKDTHEIQISPAGAILAESIEAPEAPAPAAALPDALQKAPAAVQAAVAKLVGRNKIGEFDAEVDGSKTVYDLEYKIKGTGYAADISPAGDILQREVDVDLSVVPPAVMAAAQKAHPDGKISEPSLITAGDKMFYGLEAQVGKDSHEMQISPSGALLADAIEAPEAPATPAAAAAEKKEEKD